MTFPVGKAEGNIKDGHLVGAVAFMLEVVKEFVIYGFGRTAVNRDAILVEVDYEERNGVAEAEQSRPARTRL